MISIITPINKFSDSFHLTVESILGQQGEYEWIIVVNGALKSAEISNYLYKFINCDSKKNKLLKKVKILNSSNYGVSSARNYGVSMSSGKYILFLDADDYISPNFLVSVEDFICSNSSVDAICVPGKEFNLNKSNHVNIMKSANLIRKNGVLPDQIVLANGIRTPSGFIIKKSLFYNFDERVSFLEDYLMFITLFSKNVPFYVFNTVCYYYFSDEKSSDRVKRYGIKKIESGIDHVLSSDAFSSLSLQNKFRVRTFLSIIYSKYAFKRMRILFHYFVLFLISPVAGYEMIVKKIRRN